MFKDNKDFLRFLEKNYPDMTEEDWDNFDENPELYPDVYKIDGIHENGDHFGISKEYMSIQEAENFIEKLKINPSLTTWTPKEIESMKIRKSKSDRILDLSVMHSLRKQCKEEPDKNHFPIYLP